MEYGLAQVVSNHYTVTITHYYAFHTITLTLTLADLCYY